MQAINRPSGTKHERGATTDYGSRLSRALGESHRRHPKDIAPAAHRRGRLQLDAHRLPLCDARPRGANGNLVAARDRRLPNAARGHTAPRRPDVPVRRAAVGHRLDPRPAVVDHPLEDRHQLNPLGPQACGDGGRAAEGVMSARPSRSTIELARKRCFETVARPSWACTPRAGCPWDSRAGRPCHAVKELLSKHALTMATPVLVLETLHAARGERTGTNGSVRLSLGRAFSSAHDNASRTVEVTAVRHRRDVYRGDRA